MFIDDQTRQSKTCFRGQFSVNVGHDGLNAYRGYDLDHALCCAVRIICVSWLGSQNSPVMTGPPGSVTCWSK